MTRWTLADLGDPVATGRTSEVYAHPGRPDRVLKLFHGDVPGEEVEAEAEHIDVAVRAGLTGARCHGTAYVDDRTGLVLDRLDGGSLTRVAERNPLQLRRSGRTLARLQARMHEVAAPDLTDVRAAVLHALDQAALSFLSPIEQAHTRGLVNALPDGDRLLHLDFHPENVIVTGDTTPADRAGSADRVVHHVIDWQTALRGDPAADVAATFLLFRDAELFPGLSLARKAVIVAGRRAFFEFYWAEYRRLTGLGHGAVAAWRAPALVLRLAWDIPSERDRLRAALRAALAADDAHR
ncbi:aminoglycoside phosphotransferase family protein [Nocardioides ferulae]|uniref:aminoglycoside phosphotransferase family protein n=1 Tax=Nocardioides ferulae TaxID=2340821 RepID=UPI000EB01C3A|nr:aminoglycoside phosphotransferase family protein [Nocardioides ferulae]